VHRAIALAEMAGVPVYIVHLSSEDALNQVREARDRGLPALQKTCPQYLLLSLEDVADKGWEGGEVCFHAAAAREAQSAKNCGKTAERQSAGRLYGPLSFLFRRSEGAGKDDFTQRFPMVVPAIENRLQLLHHHGVGLGNLTLQRFVELVSTAPARIFGMYPKKGCSRWGAMRISSFGIRRLRHTSAPPRTICALTTPCLKDSKVRGNARDVYSRGELIVSKSEFIGKPRPAASICGAQRAGGAWK